MERRAFVGSLALGTLAIPQAARAQPARKVYRIGMLALGMTSDMIGPQPRYPATNALLRGLRELSYVYGEHFMTDLAGAKAGPSTSPGPMLRAG